MVVEYVKCNWIAKNTINSNIIPNGYLSCRFNRACLGTPLMKTIKLNRIISTITILTINGFIKVAPLNIMAIYNSRYSCVIKGAFKKTRKRLETIFSP